MTGNDWQALPRWFRATSTFIERVGFPILAFLLMFYLCFKTLRDNTSVLMEIKESLVSINARIPK